MSSPPWTLALRSISRDMVECGIGFLDFERLGGAPRDAYLSRALCQAGAAFPAEEERPRMSNDFTGVFLLTASFPHCDMDGKEIICRGMETEGYSMKMDGWIDGWTARHLSSKMIRLSRHENKHMYDSMNG